MARWIYTLRWGKTLREAITAEDTEMVVKGLIACYRELFNKLSDEDKEWYEEDITLAIDSLDYIDRMGVEDEDEEEINDYLEEFYDLCDELMAWIET
jgi:archaellum biogenesis ATPase FlaH